MAPGHPLAGLALTTPRLDLRPDDDDGLHQLAAAARLGIHDPAEMPFLEPWTDSVDTEGFVEGMVDHHRRLRAELSPESWTIAFLARRSGVVIGVQYLEATEFARCRGVTTGSWLTRRSQGRGFGTAMRAAVLRFAFDHLGACVARSSSFADNPAARAISARLGYREDRVELRLRRGVPVSLHHVSVDRRSFVRPPSPVVVYGLAGTRGLLGARTV